MPLILDSELKFDRQINSSKKYFLSIDKECKIEDSFIEEEWSWKSLYFHILTIVMRYMQTNKRQSSL